MQLNFIQLKTNHYSEVTKVVHYISAPSEVYSYLTEIQPPQGQKSPHKNNRNWKHGTHPSMSMTVSISVSTATATTVLQWWWSLTSGPCTAPAHRAGRQYGAQAGCGLGPGWSPAATLTQVQAGVCWNQRKQASTLPQNGLGFCISKSSLCTVCGDHGTGGSSFSLYEDFFVSSAYTVLWLQ